MSIIAAITDGTNIYVSYDSLHRHRDAELVDTLSNDQNKVVKINERIAVGITGASDPSRTKFLAEFAAQNSSVLEFNEIFGRIWNAIYGWSLRRQVESFRINVMGFNGATPMFRSIVVEARNPPVDYGEYTNYLLSGDGTVVDRIEQALLAETFSTDLPGALHDLVDQVVADFPEVVGRPVYDIVLSSSGTGA